MRDLPIVKVNSTYYGGGGAQILSSLTLLTNEAGIKTGRQVIRGRPDFFTDAKRNHRDVCVCGEAPANYPKIARFFAGLGIDSMSVNAASLLRTFTVIAEAEKERAGTPLAER